jgi:glycine cleavage system regulatory protein
MERMLVMTVIGADRPGLVDLVASVVTRHGGNWLQSRMARLGGQFAGILRVAVSSEQQGPLITDLTALQNQGLNVTVAPDQPEQTTGPARINILEIVGQDRPGIVRQISGALASFGVNVEELETECDSAAMTGENLFKAHARLRIPETCNTLELRRELEKIASDLIVEISLAELQAQ